MDKEKIYYFSVEAVNEQGYPHRRRFWGFLKRKNKNLSDA